MWIDHSDCGKVTTTTDKQSFAAQVTAYATSGTTLLACSLVGAGTSLDAIRANMSKGNSLSFMSTADREYNLNKHWGDKNKEAVNWITSDQKYKVYKTRLHLLGWYDHYIMINTCLLQYQIDDPESYAIGQIGESDKDVIARAMRNGLDIPVLPHWLDWIVAHNQTKIEQKRIRDAAFQKVKDLGRQLTASDMQPYSSYNLHGIIEQRGRGFNIWEVPVKKWDGKDAYWVECIQKALRSGELSFEVNHG